jgi:hypothetical protein
METKKHWFADVEEDPETGDLVMVFPPGMLEELGWTQGDMLVWDVADNGDVSLKKKHDQDQ